MVLAGVCFEGKGRLQLVEEQGKRGVLHEQSVDKKLVEDCLDLLGDDSYFSKMGRWRTERRRLRNGSNSTVQTSLTRNLGRRTAPT